MAGRKNFPSRKSQRRKVALRQVEERIRFYHHPQRAQDFRLVTATKEKSVLEQRLNFG
jgi:hypothetical protein